MNGKSGGDVLAAYVEERYPLLVAARGDDTVAPRYRPLPDGMPESLGSCLATSCVLYDDICRDFSSQQFCLIQGRVYGILAAQVVIKRHIWISRQRHFFNGIGLIDGSSDQATGVELPGWIVASYDEARERYGVVYQAYRFFRNAKSLIGFASKRGNADAERYVQIMRERYDALKAAK